MVKLWIRAESRPNEARTGVTPEGVAALIAAGYDVTVEESRQRSLPMKGYSDAGAKIAREGGWVDAPGDAIIIGLKELPEDGTPLRHRHVMFGHAYKGQSSGRILLERFRAGGGALYDLEYLTDETGRRVAAFGYWAGYAGAAVTLMALAAQPGKAAAIHAYPSAEALREDVAARLAGASPRALVIGALGRVGTGAADLCEGVGVAVTKWDMAETASGGPFPEILAHEVFLNCILARPGTPVFVPKSALAAERALRAIGDIACDPDSDFNPVPLYDTATSWENPVHRVHEDPVLDLMAIDNLPSMLPVESSEDFAGQLLPHLLTLDRIDEGVWGRARALYDEHAARL